MTVSDIFQDSDKSTELERNSYHLRWLLQLPEQSRALIQRRQLALMFVW